MGQMLGTAELWAVADSVGLVPAPPSDELTERLTAWWAMPPRFGCRAGTREPWWTVVAPDPSIWCTHCADQRLALERRCLFCFGVIDDELESAFIAYEMSGPVPALGRVQPVRVLGRAHNRCCEGVQ